MAQGALWCAEGGFGEGSALSPRPPALPIPPQQRQQRRVWGQGRGQNMGHPRTPPRGTAAPKSDGKTKRTVPPPHSPGGLSATRVPPPCPQPCPRPCRGPLTHLRPATPHPCGRGGLGGAALRSHPLRSGLAGLRRLRRIRERGGGAGRAGRASLSAPASPDNRGGAGVRGRLRAWRSARRPGGGAGWWWGWWVGGRWVPLASPRLAAGSVPFPDKRRISRHHDEAVIGRRSSRFPRHKEGGKRQ